MSFHAFIPSVLITVGLLVGEVSGDETAVERPLGEESLRENPADEQSAGGPAVLASIESASAEMPEFSTWAEQVVGVDTGPDSFKRVTLSEILHGSPVESAPTWKQRAAVRLAQRRLVEDGFDCGSIDGIPGPKTRAAIADFQVQARLANNGLIDNPTYVALGITEEQLASSRPIATVRRDDDGLGRRMKRSFNKALWHMGL